MRNIILTMVGLPAFWIGIAVADMPEGHEGMAYREIQAQEVFPLAIGNYWVYEGTAKIFGNSNVYEFNVVERIEVEQQVNNSDYSLYTCKGHPLDVLGLEDYEFTKGKSIVEIPGQKCGYLVNQNMVYDVLGAQLEDFKKAIASEEPSKALAELGLDEVLDFPLVVGKSFGSVAEGEREDHWYEWYVKEVAPSAKWQVNGKQGEEYHLTFYTNPSRIDVWFVPGIGITRYVYHHNGTVADVDIILKEYHLSGN